MHAVVLTGRVLPDADEHQAWAKVAALFKLEPGAFDSRVLAYCPLSIRETADEAEARRILAALNGCGAQAEIVESDGTKWNLRQDDRICGPVPYTYLKREYEAGRLIGAGVKKSTDEGWTLLSIILEKSDPELILDIPPEQKEELPPSLPPRQAITAPTQDAIESMAASPTVSQPPAIGAWKVLVPAALVLVSYVFLAWWVTAILLATLLLSAWLRKKRKWSVRGAVATGIVAWLVATISVAVLLNAGSLTGSLPQCGSDSVLKTYQGLRRGWGETIYGMDAIQEQLFDQQHDYRICSLKVTYCNEARDREVGQPVQCPKNDYALFAVYYGTEGDKAKNVFTVQPRQASDLQTLKGLVERKAKYTFEKGELKVEFWGQK